MEGKCFVNRVDGAHTMQNTVFVSYADADNREAYISDFIDAVFGGGAIHQLRRKKRDELSWKGVYFFEDR